MIKKNEKWLMLIVLPLTVCIFSAIWFVRTNSANLVRVSFNTPVCDIRGFDISDTCLRLSGDSSEFINDELLSPGEFDRREDIQSGSPVSNAQCYTARNYIVLLSDETVALSFASADYANNIYINGELIQRVGHPGTSAEDVVPATTRVYYTIKPVNGVIEIVNQVSNFVHVRGGSVGGIYIGSIDSMSKHYARQTQGTSVILGIYLLLFLVHVILFMLQKSYKANLFLALFSLVVFTRTGLTGMKVLHIMFPEMSWYLSLKLEYISLPLCCLLMSLALAGMFKGLFQKPVVIASIIVNTVEVSIIILFPTVLMTRVLPLFQLTIIIVLIYVLIRFFILFSRGRSSEYIAALCALIFMLYVTVREIFMHMNILIFPVVNDGMLDLAMTVFIIFLMTASFIGTIREIDAARRNEQKLENENAALSRVNSLKTELMTTVSHELRTPLAVIMGYAQLLMRETDISGISEQTMVDLDSIVSETKRLTRIVDKMQTLSPAHADGKALPVSVAAIVQNVASMYGPILERRRTTLEIRVPVDDSQVLCGSDELTQVLFNLLSNAGKHTENGAVSIIVERDSCQVLVTVEDNGTGIEPEFLDKVFERYSHGDVYGVGLGLTICKEIIESHGGRISIDSAYGEWTRVSFSLPTFEREEN